MPRDVYLITYAARPFNDHWAIFVAGEGDGNVGTRIEVEGDVRSGFMHAIERGFDLAEDERKPRCICLGQVSDEHLHAISRDGSVNANNMNPRNKLEETVLSVHAPGPSMNQIGTDAVSLISSSHLIDWVYLQNMHSLLRRESTSVTVSGGLVRSFCFSYSVVSWLKRR